MNPLRSLFLHISRMPPAVMLMLIIGVAVVVTVVVTDKLHQQELSLANQQDEMKKKWEAKGTVVYAIKDIPEGQSISSELLEERSIELNKVPQDAVTTTTLATGRVAKYGISAGAIVSQHDLAPVYIQQGFESRLKEGMRAVTFAVDNNTGVAGFINPDSHIDIIGMVGSGAETKAAPILSDVEVVAVGQTYQKAANGAAVPASSVTVAATPEDTQKLIKAICASKLYLALRNGKDHTPLATVDVTSLFTKAKATGNELIGLQPPAGAALPPELNLPAPPVIGSLPEVGNAQPPKPSMHEVEMWFGSKKDIATLRAD